MALRPKPGLLQSHLCLRPKWGDFDKLGKIQPDSRGLNDGNKTFCVSLCTRRKEFRNRCIFEFSTFFRSKTSKIVLNFLIRINPFPDIPHCSWWFLLIFLMKMYNITKIRRTLFEYFGEITFWRFSILLQNSSKCNFSKILKKCAPDFGYFVYLHQKIQLKPSGAMGGIGKWIYTELRI